MNKLLNLAEESLNLLSKNKLNLSSILRNTIRIARIANDFENLYLFEIENGLHGDLFKKIQNEIAPHFTRDGFRTLHEKCVEIHLQLRTNNRLKELGEDSHILGFSVAEMEDRIIFLQKSIENCAPPPNHIHSYDWMTIENRNSKLRDIYQQSLEDTLTIYERIKSYVFTYLSMSERRLTTGEIRSDIILINKKYVEDKLHKLNPKIYDQLVSASERAIAGDEESLSHSLTSCRRILKSLADYLYPPAELPVIGADGKERILNDDKYISRIIQFIYGSKSGSTSLKILVENFESFGKRIEDIYSISSKGVHTKVSKFEVFQCLEQLYLVTGDLLRLHEGNSAILEDLPKAEFQ